MIIWEVSEKKDSVIHDHIGVFLRRERIAEKEEARVTAYITGNEIMFR